MPPVGASRFRETAHLAALISPSSAQKLGISLCGESLLVNLSSCWSELSLFFFSGMTGERNWTESLKRTFKSKIDAQGFVRKSSRSCVRIDFSKRASLAAGIRCLAS
jgi:hypothetical protein